MGDFECTMASFNTQLTLLFACFVAWVSSPTEIPSEITQNAMKFPPDNLIIKDPWSGLQMDVNGWWILVYCLWTWILAPAHHVYLVFTCDRPRSKSPKVQVVARYLVFGVVYYFLVAYAHLSGLAYIIGLVFSYIIYR